MRNKLLPVLIIIFVFHTSYVLGASVNRADLKQVSKAKSILVKNSPLNPVEGIDVNIVAMVNNLINSDSTGVVATIYRSYNTQISAQGNITYGATSVTGKVILTLTKNKVSVSQSVTVIVPAGNPDDTDVDKIAEIKAALLQVTLKPIEGKDENVIAMVQTLVDNMYPNILIGITSSHNSQISADGVITYGDAEVAGKVTFIIKSGTVADSVDILAIVPSKATIIVSVTSFGANGSDLKEDTAAIQKAIDSVNIKGGGTVYVPDGIYLINPVSTIKLKNNITLNLSEKATLKAMPTTSDTYAVIKISSVRNVKIIGGNIIGERDEHLGTGGEWGHGIRITGSNDIYISNIKISDCWGDGIYIGSNSLQNYSSRVTIEKFKINRARRNGISLISGKHVTIRDGEVSNTIGTKPQCGIDLEPNKTDEYLQDIIFENILSSYNVWYGIKFSFAKYVYTNNPADITLRNFSGFSNGLGLYNDWLKYEPQNPLINVVIE